MKEFGSIHFFLVVHILINGVLYSVKSGGLVVSREQFLHIHINVDFKVLVC